MTHSVRRRTWLSFLTALSATTKTVIMIAGFAMLYFVVRMVITVGYALAN